MGNFTRAAVSPLTLSWRSPCQPDHRNGTRRSGRDAMGVGLAALNRLASAPVIDRLKLRKPMERPSTRPAAPASGRSAPPTGRSPRCRRSAAPSARQPRPSASLFDLDAHRRAEDDRRGDRRVRRRAAAPGRRRRRHRVRGAGERCSSARSPNSASPRSASPRRSAAWAPSARRPPASWSPRRWRTATWVWRWPASPRPR